MFELNVGYIYKKKTELFGRFSCIGLWIFDWLNRHFSTYQLDHVRSFKSNSNPEEQYLSCTARREELLLKCFYPFFTGTFAHNCVSPLPVSVDMTHWIPTVWTILCNVLYVSLIGDRLECNNYRDITVLNAAY